MYVIKNIKSAAMFLNLFLVAQMLSENGEQRFGPPIFLQSYCKYKRELNTKQFKLLS